MFSPTNTPALGRRLFGALGLIRSFLLLEDHYECDWEVGQDELHTIHPSRRETAGVRPNQDHPHRLALQSRLGARRPGVPTPREQVCLCPLPPRTRRIERDPQRGSRITTGRDRVVTDR